MTEALTRPVDPALLVGKTRAELLDLCLKAHLRATGWKKERMFAELTGDPSFQKDAPAGPAIARQIAERPPSESGEAARKKALEERLKHTGRCDAVGCRSCEAYEQAGKDAFGWQLCECGHTQWAHAKAQG